MTATWSNSRPFVPCAVARVNGASSRRSSARRRRVATIRLARSAIERQVAAQPSSAAAAATRSDAAPPSSARSGSSCGSMGCRPICRSASRPIVRRGVADIPVVPRSAAAAASSSSSTTGDSIGSCSPAARNGSANRIAAATTGSSSRFVRARTARVPSSAGHEASAAAARSTSSAADGARISRPVAAGPARITLANRSPLCSTSRTARSRTGAGHR